MATKPDGIDWAHSPDQSVVKSEHIDDASTIDTGVSLHHTEPDDLNQHTITRSEQFVSRITTGVGSDTQGLRQNRDTLQIGTVQNAQQRGPSPRRSESCPPESKDYTNPQGPPPPYSPPLSAPPDINKRSENIIIDGHAASMSQSSSGNSINNYQVNYFAPGSVVQMCCGNPQRDHTMQHGNQEITPEQDFQDVQRVQDMCDLKKGAQDVSHDDSTISLSTLTLDGPLKKRKGPTVVNCENIEVAGNDGDFSTSSNNFPPCKDDNNTISTVEELLGPEHSTDSPHAMSSHAFMPSEPAAMSLSLAEDLPSTITDFGDSEDEAVPQAEHRIPDASSTPDHPMNQDRDIGTDSAISFTLATSTAARRQDRRVNKKAFHQMSSFEEQYEAMTGRKIDEKTIPKLPTVTKEQRDNIRRFDDGCTIQVLPGGKVCFYGDRIGESRQQVERVFPSSEYTCHFRPKLPVATRLHNLEQLAAQSYFGAEFHYKCNGGFLFKNSSAGIPMHWKDSAATYRTAFITCAHLILTGEDDDHNGYSNRVTSNDISEEMSTIFSMGLRNAKAELWFRNQCPESKAGDPLYCDGLLLGRHFHHREMHESVWCMDFILASVMRTPVGTQKALEHARATGRIGRNDENNGHDVLAVMQIKSYHHVQKLIADKVCLVPGTNLTARSRVVHGMEFELPGSVMVGQKNVITAVPPSDVFEGCSGTPYYVKVSDPDAYLLVGFLASQLKFNDVDLNQRPKKYGEPGNRPMYNMYIHIHPAWPILEWLGEKYPDQFPHGIPDVGYALWEKENIKESILHSDSSDSGVGTL